MKYETSSKYKSFQIRTQVRKYIARLGKQISLGLGPFVSEPVVPPLPHLVHQAMVQHAHLVANDVGQVGLSRSGAVVQHVARRDEPGVVSFDRLFRFPHHEAEKGARVAVGATRFGIVAKVVGQPGKAGRRNLVQQEQQDSVECDWSLQKDREQHKGVHPHGEPRGPEQAFPVSSIVIITTIDGTAATTKGSRDLLDIS